MTLQRCSLFSSAGKESSAANSESIRCSKSSGLEARKNMSIHFHCSCKVLTLDVTFKFYNGHCRYVPHLLAEISDEQPSCTEVPATDEPAYCKLPSTWSSKGGVVTAIFAKVLVTPPPGMIKGCFR